LKTGFYNDVLRLGHVIVKAKVIDEKFKAAHAKGF
jgi:hypothetical protein